jgi:hypothetical protein
MFTMNTNTRMSDGDDDKENPRRSINDKKLDAALLLHNQTARLQDVHGELLSRLDAITPSDSKTRASIRDIRNVLLPMMGSVVNEEIPQAIKTISPIPSVGYIHNRRTEAEETRKAKASQSRKKKDQTIPFRRVQNALNEHKMHPNKRMRTTTRQIPILPSAAARLTADLLPNVIATRSTTREVDPIIRVPPPLGGSYTAPECVRYLLPMTGQERSAIVEMQYLTTLVSVIEYLSLW